MNAGSTSIPASNDTTLTGSICIREWLSPAILSAGDFELPAQASRG